jgi:hypothetical protein
MRTISIRVVYTPLVSENGVVTPYRGRDCLCQVEDLTTHRYWNEEQGQWFDREDFSNPDGSPHPNWMLPWNPMYRRGSSVYFSCSATLITGHCYQVQSRFAGPKGVYCMGQVTQFVCLRSSPGSIAVTRGGIY